MNIGSLQPTESKERKELRKNILQVLQMKTTNENKSHHLADLFAIYTFKYIGFTKETD